MNGHAIECRIYAEDPDQNFMPSPGRILRLQVPAGPGVRDDGGVYEGGEVSIYYDPMISKFAVHGKDRNEAIESIRRALTEYRVDGIKTTIPFFREVLNDPIFVAGDLDTGFISAFLNGRNGKIGSNCPEDLAIVAAALAAKNPERQPAAEFSEMRTQSRWATSGRLAQMNSKL